MKPRQIFFFIAIIVTPLSLYHIVQFGDRSFISIITLLILLVGWRDYLQKSNAILRDYPIVGNLRYLLRAISPELHQYFVESNTDGKPFSKNTIKTVKLRANNKEAIHPFGTEHDFYENGIEWIGHATFPAIKIKEPPRIRVGNEQCSKPYSASLLNISAMSFGSLSENAIKALNHGAALGNFYHNTGEGGLTPFHQKGGDVVLQIGTGNFGFRNDDGTFSDKLFEEKSNHNCVKMIEIKMSQGAKPGHGGVLPAIKNTEQIAKIRSIKPHTEVISPPLNPEIKTFSDFPKFLKRVRSLSKGKPVGFKLCIGIPTEFEKLISIFIEHNEIPDFITIDASEGGTGAAPIEYTNHIGMRGDDALIYANQTLINKGIRDKVKIIYSGKIINGFTIYKALCLGADLCNSARGFMFSLGCIQALRCNTDECPTGVATQNQSLQKGLVSSVKSHKVHNYQKNTVESFLEIMATTGIEQVSDLKPSFIRTASHKISNV